MPRGIVTTLAGQTRRSTKLRKKLVPLALCGTNKGRVGYLDRVAHQLRAQQQGAGRPKVAKEQSRGNANDRWRGSRKVQERHEEGRVKRPGSCGQAKDVVKCCYKKQKNS